MTAAVVLSTQNLELAHPRGPAVLRWVNLDITVGSRTAVIGANGSGKTTLLRALSGALPPQSGTVLRDGSAIEHTRAGLNAHRQAVQLVLQDPDDQLFSADVAQDVSFGPLNLGLPVAEVGARVSEALALMGITHLADRPVHALSYGQRKRVAIAGALAMRPRVLLLDEPTAGLDPAGVTTLHASIEAVEQHGTTVVLSTHDIAMAWAWADHVVLVDEGTVRQDHAVPLLSDQQALSKAGLNVPWQVSLCQALGIGYSDEDAPRTVHDMAAALRPAVVDVRVEPTEPGTTPRRQS